MSTKTISMILPKLPYPLNIPLYNKFSLYGITTLIGYVLATSFYKLDGESEE